MMALLVHGGLLIALALGVSWRSSEPAGISAELWAAVPQAAAPAAVEPLPPPPMPKVEPKPEPKVEPPPPKPETRDADIAIEKQKAAEKEKREEQEREKLERQKAERDREAKLEKEKREKADNEKRAVAVAAAQEAQRQANLQRMLNQAGATGAPQSTGTAQRDAGPSANYAGKIRARVQPNIVLTESVPPTLLASVELRVAPDGTITARRLVKSSGNAIWDEAVLRAIDRTETLPKDENGRVQSPMIIDFKPV